MSFDSQTFEHRKALLHLGDLLSDDDSKKIVFVEGLPKVLEEKSPWEVLAHLEVQGKATVKELTRILKAINRHDAAKKAKELIGKPHRRKKDPECKALMLEDSLQLAEKHCKVLVEQVDYLKFAANKDGNKRIEELASEAKKCLENQVQHKLRYASGLFRSQSDHDSTVDSSSNASSPADTPSPVSSPHTIRTHSELKKAAEMLKKPMLQKGSTSHTVPQTLNGTGMPAVRQASHDRPPNKTKDTLNGDTSAVTSHQARDEEEEDPYTLPGDPNEDDEDPYTLPGPLKVTAKQNTTPTYENLPSGGHTAEGATDDVSSTDDYSCSTCSYTGDSGFSDSRAFRKPLPPSSSQRAHYQREQGSDINSSALYTSLITTDVQTKYYKSLNMESRIPDVIYATSGHPSSENK